jgi:hypothetical protein
VRFFQLPTTPANPRKTQHIGSLPRAGGVHRKEEAHCLQLLAMQFAALSDIRVGRVGLIVITSLKELIMSDDKTKTGAQDRKRIKLSEDYEVRDWAAKFGVTPEQLKAAVAAVGSQASAVEAHLQSTQR